MATTTCSAVTIEVGERNHAVPLIPRRLEAAFLSSSSKYLEMLTVERVSAAGATHSATARVQGRSRTSRDNNQGRMASRRDPEPRGATCARAARRRFPPASRYVPVHPLNPEEEFTGGSRGPAHVLRAR